MGLDATALERDLPERATVLLDTAVLIAYLNGGEAITDAATLLIDGWVRTGRNRALIGMVSAMELLVGPIRAGRATADVIDFLQRFPNITCVPLNFTAALEAATIRAQSGLKPPDALIIGTGIASGVDVIVTNDGAWAGKSAKPVITLSDYIT